MKAVKRKTVAVIGAGRLGGAFGLLLAEAGYRILAVTGRSRRSAAAAARFIGAGEPLTDIVQAAADAAIVLITTPDRVIGEICVRLARNGGLRRGALVAHASGAQTRELLAPAREAGALGAVIHPLQSVPTREQGVVNIPGSYFRIEADPGALRCVRALVRALGGRELALPRWRSDPESVALYHAGAVAASNYLVTLLDFAARHFEELGVDRQQALRALLPLVRGTLANIERLGIPQALTGPIARGDAPTIAGHVAALRGRAPELLELYRNLARQTLALAREQGGLTAQAAEALKSSISEIPPCKHQTGEGHSGGSRDEKHGKA